MTAEEAIEILNQAERYVGIHYVNGVEDAYISPRLAEAINFAIKAISKQQKHK